ncbi:MAG: DUF4249 domain-containing protein [Sphingobacteriaceae bacterium]|nr:DUF4249 domain-containing protein [Sphingobacteriaceae bacterium]
MKSNSYPLLYAIIILFFAACKERFEPAIDTPSTGYLVVEGNINSGNGPTVIKLSRTGRLNLGGRAEKGAEVQIVGEDLSTYNLTGNDNGVYTSAVLNLPKQRYRLRIKAGGKEYLSELLAEKQTPSIDSVSWQRVAEGVKLYVHTHDDSNKTKYYKWTFEETWEIRSELEAFYRFKTTVIPNRRNVVTVVRTTPKEQELLYYCWKSEASNEILLGSTAKLAKDVMIFPLKLIRNNDERLVFLYSINVVQTALDIRSYNFYQNLKANTESNGSIFDRQPSEISSNIKCVNNPAEMVIGNVMLTSHTEKRIFIYNPSNWVNSFVCNPSIAPTREDMFHNPDTLAKYNGPHIPLSTTEAEENTPLHPDSAAIYSRFAPLTGFYAPRVPAAYAHLFPPPKPYIIGYTMGNRSCVDCTLRGTNVKPSFWPR